MKVHSMAPHIILISLLFCLAFGVVALSCNTAETHTGLARELAVKFKGNAQIEVGSPYAGIEMHHGSPLLNRISFFYPVANSIDFSQDYWTRDTSRVMGLALRIDDGAWQNLLDKQFEFELTPYAVEFENTEDERAIQIGYRFCKDKPAFVASVKIINRSEKPQDVELLSYLGLALRTSHTYDSIVDASLKLNEQDGSVIASFEAPETKSAQIFVGNAGEKPVGVAENITPAYLQQSVFAPVLQHNLVPAQALNKPGAAFRYQKKLQPGEDMTIVQLIGSCTKNEAEKILAYLQEHHESETASYEQWVLDQVLEAELTTGDSILDHSARWAKAILATNRHYLDGGIMPMPCPAEYNFFFTHDVLVTDLAAVNFDPERVKRDLQFLAQYARADSVIPHAYYWKDDRYVTEYAGSDNWNHFWFVLACASYLRHAGDVETIGQLYPYIAKSLSQVKQNIIDDLMWAEYPDWWDIGHTKGKRAYMTILAIRSLRDFSFVSARLGQNVNALFAADLELADRMQAKLTTELWDDELGYLINFNENNIKDSHYFIGSLLAAHFDLLDPARKQTLMQTASQKLLDPKLGIYNVFPMDLHLRKDVYRFRGDEAGQPGFYANGGIWPHGNAWYALGLMSVDKYAEARHFLTEIMTVKGIMHSPNGQPAMYEYRVSNPQPAVYGKVDKPQFMWAGGWYLYCLYQLLGVQNNVWNIALAPAYVADLKPEFIVYAQGQRLHVSITGKGNTVREIKYDGRRYPALVVPKTPVGQEVEIVLGEPLLPYLASATAALESAEYDSGKERMTLLLSAFESHESKVEIVSRSQPSALFLNGSKLEKTWISRQKNNSYVSTADVTHSAGIDTLTINF